MAKVILGFGGNVGNIEETFLSAFKLMDSFCCITNVSPIYKTSSLIKDNQPDYINIVVTVITDLQPLDLLSKVKNIEEELGRSLKGRWLERNIDIDIIDYDGEIYRYTKEETRRFLSDNSTNLGLNIPHNELSNRSFVLVPLNDIYPNYVHPKSGLTIQQLIKELEDKLNIKQIGRLSWQ